jgi:hypothetical protein
MNAKSTTYATGVESTLNLGALYRTQWVEFVAPQNIDSFAHMPVNKKVEVGFSLFG